MARLVDGDRTGHGGSSESEMWHVLVNAGDTRLVGLDELDRMFHRGEVTEDTLVWKKGMRGWIKLELAVGLDSDAIDLPAPELPTRPFVAQPGVVSASSLPPPVDMGMASPRAAVSPHPAVVNSRPPGLGAALPPPPRPPMPSRELDGGWSSVPVAVSASHPPRSSGLPPAPRVPSGLGAFSVRPGAAEPASDGPLVSSVGGDWVKELIGDDDAEEGTLTEHRRGPVPPPSGPPPRSLDVERRRVARPVPPPPATAAMSEVAVRQPRPVPLPSAPPSVNRSSAPPYPPPQAASAAPGPGSVSQHARGVVTPGPSVIVLEPDALLDDESGSGTGRRSLWLWVGAAALVLVVSGYRHDILPGAASAMGFSRALAGVERATLGGAPFGTVRSVRELVASHPVDMSEIKFPAAVDSRDANKH